MKQNGVNMAKKTKPEEIQTEEQTIPILNGSGQYQEIHYLDKTINVAPGESHDLIISKINRAELSRIKHIFTEIISQKKNDSADNINPPVDPDIPAEPTGQDATI